MTNRRRAHTAPPNTAVGYLRVSTAEQAESGAGLAAGRATLEAEAVRRGITLVAIYEDAGVSGKSMDGREGLADALHAVEVDRIAAALMVPKLDRLSRSVQDLAGLLDRAQRQRWALIAADLGVDTSTPAGEAMANVMASFAQLERRLIGQRTREGLAARRAEGVRLGRPSTLPAAVVARIVTAHDGGAGWSTIARDLNDDRVPTAQGGTTWYPATVRKVYLGQDAAQLTTT